MKLIRVIEKNDRFILNHVQDEEGNSLVVKSFTEDYPGLDTMAQLKNEIEIGKQLSHPGIRNILQEVFFDNRKCLSMEFIDGENMRSKGPMELSEFFRFSISLAQTLDYLHGQGIIHRDISSFNILQNRKNGDYILIDFGTAIRMDAHVIPQNLIGTPIYVSPEMTGRMQIEPDQRADLYSLGIVFYEMLTGTNPFEDKSDMQIIYKQLAWKADDPSIHRAGLPVTLSKIVMKLIEKAPEKRYRSAIGLRHDLEEARLLFQRNVVPSSFEPGSIENPPPFNENPLFVQNDAIMSHLEQKLRGLVSGKSQFLELKGPKGAGKSLLIQKLIPQFIEDQILYTRIDVDSKKSRPYAWLFDLFTRILNMINEEPDELISIRRARFFSDDISDVSFLVDRLPGLKWFIEGTSLAVNDNSLQSQNRFQLALQDLMRILALPERPLVVHFTGSEMLDTESKEFLHEFSGDVRDEFVWIILEEDTPVDDSLPLHIEDSGIYLAGMGSEPILRIFTSMVVGTTFNLDFITGQLLKFSQGLPGKAVDIINYWYTNHFLQFDTQRSYWFWEEQKSIPLFPESLVSAIRIENDAQADIIEWASLLDEKFTFEMLRALSDAEETELRHALERLNINGQIVSFRNGKEYYSLSGITEGFHSQLGMDEMARRHIKVVEYLAKAPKKDYYRIAYHMNKSIECGWPDFRGDAALQSNLQAGLNAKNEGAFKLARTFLSQALMERERAAKVDTHTYYTLYLNSAELAQLAGDYEEAEKWYQHALDTSSDDIEKAEIFSRQLSLYNHQGKLDKSFHSGRQALAFLGFPIPKEASNLQIFLNLALIWMKIGWKDPASLKHLPVMTDARVRLSLKILQDLHAVMFNISNKLLFFTLLKALQKLLKYGNAPEGSYAYSGFGAILAVGFGSYKKGWAFTEVGWEIIEQLPSKKYRAGGLVSKAGWLINYVEHSRNGIPMLEEALKLNKEVGDFTNASFSAMFLSEAMFMTGYPLTVFEKKVNEFISFTFQNGYDDMLAICLLTKRYILQLTDREHEIASLEEEWFRSRKLEAYTLSTSFKHLRTYFLILESYWNFYNGQYEEGMVHCQEADKLLFTLQGPAIIVDYYFIKGLLSYEMARKTQNQVRYRKQLSQTVRKLRKYAGLVEDNFSHRYLVLKSLQLFLKGKAYLARNSMREAQSLARKHEYIQIETTASVYLARWFKEIDQKGYSRLHFRDAINATEKWEAGYLTKRIYSEFEEFGTLSASSHSSGRSVFSLSSRSGSSASSNPEILMKAALSVSSETDFESLLNAMNTIFLEQAGATRSLLFIKSKSQLNVLYEMEGLERSYFPYPGKSIKRLQHFPKSIIQLVMRSLEPIVIADSGKDQHFRFEQYFRDKAGFSVMVVPMLYRGALSGILYFENTLLTGAFSSSRQELINLLSGQFAVSLQNAQLVEELEQRVKERTEALESEKDRSDLLLKNILPAETAEELKHRGIATPRFYRNVSVVFTDFVGFTKISENMPPTDLVKMLDYYFREFDRIVTELGLEKIKTIGDSYLFVAGLPVESATHAQDAADAAIRILQFVEETKRKGTFSLDLRIGLHSGPVISGVVGENKFAFDIWGDTVNTASRMESNSESGKINISRETLELLEPLNRYRFTYRGKIEAKNKGEIDMYFVDQSPEPSPDVTGAIQYILDQLKNNLSAELSYHSIGHTLEVMANVERIGLAEGISQPEMDLALTAAAYHDSGFLQSRNDHEALSCQIAAEVLPGYGFSPGELKHIQEMIMATKIPQQPNDLLGKILCDADLYYMGTEDFFPTGQTLYLELQEANILSDERTWLDVQISFLENHSYHTETVKRECEPGKQQHLKVLRKKRLELDQPPPLQD